jgi:hypothetical protein
MAEAKQLVALFAHGLPGRQQLMELGVTSDDLLFFYLGGVQAGLPSPFINHGGPMVAPTLFFMSEEASEPVVRALARSLHELEGLPRVAAARLLGEEMTTGLMRASMATSGACILPKTPSGVYEAEQMGRKVMPYFIGAVILFIVIVANL